MHLTTLYLKFWNSVRIVCQKTCMQISLVNLYVLFLWVSWNQWIHKFKSIKKSFLNFFKSGDKIIVSRFQKMSKPNACRLCFSTNSTNYMNIFSTIGTELKMSDVISEHFQCDVNKITISWWILIFISHNFPHTYESFLLHLNRLATMIHCRNLCVKCVGQQPNHFMICITNRSWREKPS